MAEWLSSEQRYILHMLPADTRTEFMNSFRGGDMFPDICECIKSGYRRGDDRFCKCGIGSEITRRMLQLIQDHPKWGETIECVVEGKTIRKYKYISIPGLNAICRRKTYKRVSFLFGGHYDDEPFFSIDINTGFLRSIINSEHVQGHTEKSFIMFLNKCQVKYDSMYSVVMKDIYGRPIGDKLMWEGFDPSVMLPVDYEKVIDGYTFTFTSEIKVGKVNHARTYDELSCRNMQLQGQMNRLESEAIKTEHQHTSKIEFLEEQIKELVNQVKYKLPISEEKINKDYL